LGLLFEDHRPSPRNAIHPLVRDTPRLSGDDGALGPGSAGARCGSHEHRRAVNDDSAALLLGEPVGEAKLVSEFAADHDQLALGATIGAVLTRATRAAAMPSIFCITLSAWRSR
jgi:hypothetical protein